MLVFPKLNIIGYNAIFAVYNELITNLEFIHEYNSEYYRYIGPFYDSTQRSWPIKGYFCTPSGLCHNIFPSLQEYQAPSGLFFGEPFPKTFESSLRSLIILRNQIMFWESEEASEMQLLTTLLPYILCEEPMPSLVYSFYSYCLRYYKSQIEGYSQKPDLGYWMFYLYKNAQFEQLLAFIQLFDKYNALPLLKDSEGEPHFILQPFFREVERGQI